MRRIDFVRRSSAAAEHPFFGASGCTWELHLSRM